MAHVAADSSSPYPLNVSLDQEYRVKLGRSFTFPKQNSYHTIKYDFKPQSVDSTKPGHLKVTDDEVNVSLPVQSQGDASDESTHFRGNKKPCTKECILIIDTNTGEARLEKISNNVNLKAVRDGRKPAAVNRDRSVSPSPLMMQSKGHSASKSQLSASSSGHRHLTPSPIPSATPTASNNSTPSATKGGVASSGGSNATPGSSSKKAQKRQTKSKTPKTPAIVPTLSSAAQKQESKGRNGSKPKAKKKNESSSKQASIIPAAPKIKTEPAVVAPQMSTSASQASAMPSMPLIGMGMELTREISPIHSSNPTPEPIRPPSRKKQKISPLTRSSSSSSSDSSDSDSEGEEPMSQAPPIQQAPTQFSSIPVTRVTSAQSHPISSSGGSNNSMPVFSSHSQPMTQKGHIAQKSHPGQLGQAKIPPPPNQRLSSGSSSGSDSDSSSGSSSSDSSSDSSDEENDKEVAAISRGPIPPGQRAYQRSYSELKSDLQLSSDSGSSSD